MIAQNDLAEPFAGAVVVGGQRRDVLGQWPPGGAPGRYTPSVLARTNLSSRTFCRTAASSSRNVPKEFTSK
jgi:hypothetical protein